MISEFLRVKDMNTTILWRWSFISILLKLQYWFHQARGKTVEMNVYDDNHPLGKVENDVNVMINAALFFHKHLNL